MSQSGNSASAPATFCRRKWDSSASRTAGRLRVALAFPNTYFVGMSNLGFQTVYKLFNAEDGIVCERVFLPPKTELAAQLASGAPLVTLESQTPVARVRHLRVLRLLRVGLHERADAAAAGGHPAACGRAHGITIRW